MWRRYNYLKIRERLGFTGPKPNFLLGNISDFIKVAKEKGIEYTPYFRSELQKQYGETFGLYFGMMLEITSTDMEFIREVMIKQFSNFSERPIDHFFRGYPMEENLLMVPKYYAPKGIGWKEIRSIISPVFTTGKIKQMYPIMHERIETLISGLEKKIQKDNCIDIYE
uniref:Uncharacterized protein n=1 Tax=Acrobeloides nanus TaxID=290746 RepID=A0A914CI09_9BILA